VNNQSLSSTLAHSKAELLRTIRNRRFVVFSVIMPVIFFFIFTNTIKSTPEIPNWTAYYLMSMTVYGVVGASLTSFAQRMARERSQGWIRLLRITPLQSWSYIAAKIVSQGFINLCIILVMFIIGIFVKHVELSAMEWLQCGLWIWIGGLSFMAIGMLIGSTRNSDAAQVMAVIVYMSLSILGGLWFPVTTMSKTMQEIAKLTPTYRLGQGAWSIVGGNSVQWAGAAVLVGYVIVCVVLASFIMRKQETV
jgi:ABC-2 type transport system permease protein